MSPPSSPKGESSTSRRRESDSRDDRRSRSPGKRQKFSRSRTACLQCRQRKSKCGARPPNPCPNCVEADLPCAWPTEDGRSSKARLQRYRNSQLTALGRNNGGGTTNPGVLGEGWLDRLLASGAAALATPTPALPETATAGAGISPAPLGVDFPPNPFALPYPVLDSQLFPQIMTPDPAQFVWAVSSRLPTVEDASPNDERSVASDPSPANSEMRAKRGKEGKTVKVSWWRPHGQTALTPGLKKYTLRVRVASPHQAASPLAITGPVGDADLISPDGLPSTPIMRHLLDVFMTHFGCQFPFIDREDLEAKIEARTGSTFLLLSIAATAARFSNHPTIALPGLEPYEYGNVFYTRAKALLGAMLGFPRRETVAAFVLLAHMGFAADSECEVWMMTGCAVRMAIDCGLHVSPPEESSMSTEDRRLNRLVFWSVLLMDYALSFGVGRQTAFRPDDITQVLPTEEDLHKLHSDADYRSPFPYAAKMMLAYGPLINTLNRAKGRDANAARAAAIKEYNRLPADMQWNVTNLQRHTAKNHGPIFLHLHLWMHTIIASGYLTGTSLLSRSVVAEPPRQSGSATPSTSSLWRNSARTIGDILVLSDIINPHAYFALPFVNQAFFVAGCCYVKEIEQEQALAESPPPSPPPLEEESDSGSEAEPPQGSLSLSRALLTSVATTNITTLQQGLAKLAKYWYGAEWIAGALKQRIDGIRDRDVDLVEVRENFESHVSLPDSGVVRAAQVGAGVVPDEDGVELPVQGQLNDMDFLSLPFDLVEGSNVVETEVPIEQLFGSNWART